MINQNIQHLRMVNKKYNLFIIIFYLLMGAIIISVFAPKITLAQDIKTPIAVQNLTTEQIKEQNTAQKNIPFPISTFFTPEEISAIQRALLGIDTPDDDTPKVPRVLRMSGMLYKSPNNWVIWLNGKRLTPDRLLPEIIDISVNSSEIHLKWFDYGINDVISITLRPHQVYDIATGILLPG